jgi:zinc transport system substrate-binding protein
LRTALSVSPATPTESLMFTQRRLSSRASFGAALILTLSGATAALAEAPTPPSAPRVVVTIAPIHGLAAAVMEGVGAPELLVKGAFSEHTYALKPSDAQKLSEAQIVARVAPNLEIFLDKSLKNIPKEARTLNLSDQPGLTLWPMRAGGDFESHQHDEHGDHDHDDGHDHDHDDDHDGHVSDPHLWLDPSNAQLIADRLADALAQVDPSHAAQYKANAESLKTRLRALDDELRAELTPLHGKPYIVFHDAYQYFEKRYGLNPVGSISLSSAQPPSARHMMDLRQKIQRLGALCIFSEPQFDPKLANALAEGTSAQTGVLDGLGADLANGPDLYFILLRKLAQNLKSCIDR